MRILYDIVIRCYWLVARIVSIWDPKARKWIRGRQGWYGKLKSGIGPEERTIWFHCSSLGEFEQGRPVLEALRKKYPAHRILLTFFSPSGYEKRKDFEGADLVMYLPLDTAANARRLVDHLTLDMAFFVKYEFWYHVLRRLRKGGVPVYLISGHFRTGQLFFRWYGGWYRKVLHSFTHIFVQQEPSLDLLLKIGITGVSVAGDTRFDRVREVVETPYRNEMLDRFAGGHRVIVAGSTWEPDEQLLLHAYGQLPEEVRWIIAPHEVNDSHIKRLKEMFPEHILFTEPVTGRPSAARVVIVDTIGQLSFLYRYGVLAYVGGGFGKGIHNTLEAATYGLPVIFGPAYRKFHEAVELIALGAGFPVQDEAGLLSTIHQQLKDQDLLKTTGAIASNYVLSRSGATNKILEAVCKK